MRQHGRRVLCARTRGGELDRERQAREATRDLADVGALVVARRKLRHARADALDEQIDRVIAFDAAELDDALARDVERGAARDEKADLRRNGDPAPHDRRRRRQEVLQVVEDDERAGPGREHPPERRLGVELSPAIGGERAKHRLGHLARHARVAHVAEPHAAELRGARHRVSHREARLADASRPNDRHEARAAHRNVQSIEVGASPEEPRGLRTQEATLSSRRIAGHCAQLPQFSIYRTSAQQRTPTCEPA